ncbi:MAG: PIN domain-containing protein [Acidobacteriota bacterium]|nr:PIN domain-containing protein [Acidobacteriota bacterium]
MRLLALDTGPLVAFVDRREALHHWTRRVFESAPRPFVTCEAVLAEACFLLRGQRGGAEAVMGLVESGFIAATFSLGKEAGAVNKLMVRYGNVPMSLADACLVRISELREDACVLTFDTDFAIYRRHGRQEIPLLMPESLS